MIALLALTFLPQLIPTNEVSFALDILPQNHLALVESTMDGVKATLLLDTGASYTTFDLDFVKKRLPDKRLEPVQLVGNTNVKSMPKCFELNSIKLGEAEFGDFLAMAIPLGHLKTSVGRQVDGIIGMNVLASRPFLISLAKAKTVVNPHDTPTPIAIARSSVEELPRFNSRFGSKYESVLVDTGASFTFIRKDLWPATTNVVAMSATGVNGAESIRPVRGMKGTIDLGGPVEIEPLLMERTQNLLGADTLLRYDLIIDWPYLKFVSATTTTE